MTLNPAIDRRPRRGMFYTGWVLGLLPALFMIVMAVGMLRDPQKLDANMQKGGFPPGVAVPIMITEIVCVLIYLIPPTAMLGAILLTGYLGGAVCTHVHGGENFLLPLAFGVVFWLALFLRDARLRALIPWRQTSAPSRPTLSI